MRAKLIQLKTGLELIKRSVYHYFSCDLFKALTEVMAEFRAFGNYSIAKPESMESVRVLILKPALVQILENLFQNALDAMHGSAEKELFIEIRCEQSEYVNLLITNGGDFITPENRSKVFEEYFSTKQSSGLGLFHVQKLLQKYNGKITLIRSTPAEGTTFEITLRKFPDE